MEMDLTKLVQGKNLTENEQAVLEYLMVHLDTALSQGVRSIARDNYTSTSTIMRLAKKLGYSGFVDMCYNLRVMASEPGDIFHEEMNFLKKFCQPSILNQDIYMQLKAFTKHMAGSKGSLMFIYATGFSAAVGSYMACKLVNMGLRCMFASGEDSVGMFENNLECMGSFFCISKSGETVLVRDKIKTARENGIFTAAVTCEKENSVSRFADVWFRIEDLYKLDDLNTSPNTFFPQAMMLVELIAYEYLRQCKNSLRT